MKTPSGPVYKANKNPELNDVVSNLEINPILRESFHFIPGQILKFEVENNGLKETAEWEVYTNIYNYSYLYCKASKSTAYFHNDGRVFYFYDFNGDKKSLLYYFFLAAYKIPLGYYQDMSIEDTPGLHYVYSKAELFVQDFVAPFYIFLKSVFRIKYYKIDDTVHSNEIILYSEIDNSFLKYETLRQKFFMTLTRDGINKIEINQRNKTITANCIKED